MEEVQQDQGEADLVAQFVNSNTDENSEVESDEEESENILISNDVGLKGESVSSEEDEELGKSQLGFGSLDFIQFDEPVVPESAVEDVELVDLPLVTKEGKSKKRQEEFPEISEKKKKKLRHNNLLERNQTKGR